ncbi:hypothetical protein Pcinc_037049 [Petrolisthes cinctipes]|uniref:Uncharacterized protein n=1 Tax=Petrolisthes cinctipes TaxID=88211 RepID=A0AAE1BUU8_PETCI|nr:hypothetical protein Pcinc_037049 [Petrolisthes cinctipes]
MKRAAVDRSFGVKALRQDVASSEVGARATFETEGNNKVALIRLTMEEESGWSRGRSGWGGEGRGVRDSASYSPRRTHHSGSPSHKYRPNRPPVWDDTVHDLASMRLTPAELARKLASRQSSNKVFARAQLLEQSRRSGSQGLSLPPTLAARLQARQQSVDSILAQSNATLLASQKVRHTEGSPAHESHTSKDVDKNKIHDDRGSHDDILEKLRLYQDRLSHLSNDTDVVNAMREDAENERSRRPDTATAKAGNRPENTRDSGHGEVHDEAKKDQPKQVRAASSKDSKKPVDVKQLAATRTSLDHTITMVVNTCRELWMQLEEERLTREHLQRQLQQQGNIITNLTSELLLIQDQQEAIIQEVSDARASGLWGVESELAGELGENLVDGDDLYESHSLIDQALGINSNPHSLPGRHPQRSILRATRTIHPPHMRQSPPYQVLQQTGRSHTPGTHHPSSQQQQQQQPPPSPRHRQPSPLSHSNTHQPSPHTHSNTHQPSLLTHQPSPLAHQSNTHKPSPLTLPNNTHQPSPPPESSLSQSGHTSSRPDPHMMANYRNSISRQIRDTLTNERVASIAHDRSNSGTPLSFVGSDGSHEKAPEENDRRALGDGQPISVANKENYLMSGREDLGLDSGLADHHERK